MQLPGGIGDRLGEYVRYIATGIVIVLGILGYTVLPSPYSLIAPPIIIVAAVFAGIFYPILARKRVFTGIDLDLLYLAGHMLCVSTGKPPRSALFKAVGEEYPYPKYSALFRKIYLLGTQWGYSFAEACRLAARTVRNKLLRDFLIRLSGVLSVGEDVELFLTTEYNTFSNEYETTYNRQVDAARVFLGIYTTMLGATVFVLANFLLLAFFFGGDPMIVISSFLGVTAAAIALLVLLYKLVPRDVFEHKMEPRPREFKLIRISSLAASALVAAASATFLARGFTYSNIALTMILAGGVFLAPGMAAKIMEKRISEVDEFFPIFIRSYGMHLSTIPSMPKALEPLLVSELGRLNVLLRRLYARLMNGIDPRIAWRYFAAETGSELVRRGVRVFLDTVEYGGDVSKAGAIISDHQNMLLRLRRLRLQVSKTFESTMYIMHASLVLLTVFISKLILIFSEILAGLQAQVPPEVAGVFTMGALPTNVLVSSSAMFIVVSTITNALAINRAVPGTRYSFWYYLAILSLISGVGILLGSKLLDIVVSASIGSAGSLTQGLPL